MQFTLRARCREVRSSPRNRSKQHDRHSVHIRESVWARIKPFALSQKACALVELILEEWLAKPADAQAIALASDKLRRAQKKERAQERDKEAKTPRGGATRRAEQKADDVVARPKTSDAAETPRLSYEQRRKQQIAAGGTPIPVKTGSTRARPRSSLRSATEILSSRATKGKCAGSATRPTQIDTTTNSLRKMLRSNTQQIAATQFSPDSARTAQRLRNPSGTFSENEKAPSGK